MSDDKIAEIRARHLREDRWSYSPSPQMHADRATLLAEVDRLRADNERLRAELDVELFNRSLVKRALEGKP